MRDDLQGLDISHDQLQDATNLPVHNGIICNMFVFYPSCENEQKCENLRNVNILIFNKFIFIYLVILYL